MSIIVFGISSNNSEYKTDTSLFVQKPYLRTIFLKSNIEEDIDLKSRYTIKTLPDLISIREAASKNYVHSLFKNDIVFKMSSQKKKFVTFNYQPAVNEHLTPKVYVDNAIEERKLVKNKQDNNFNSHNLTNISRITLNTQAVKVDQVITKAYVYRFHPKNEQSRRNLGRNVDGGSSDLVQIVQDFDFNDNNLKNLDSIRVNRNPYSDNEFASKKYVDDSKGGGDILRFNQILQDYLKVFVGNDTYNVTKYDKIQITDTTNLKTGNTGGYLQPFWKINCNDKHCNEKVTNFPKSTKTSSPTSQSRATSLPSFGDSFTYIKTSQNISGSENAFVSFEHTDIFQISILTIYYNKLSISSNNSLTSLDRFRIQLLLADNTWPFACNILKNDRYSDSSSDWTLVG